MRTTYHVLPLVLLLVGAVARLHASETPPGGPTPAKVLAALEAGNKSFVADSSLQADRQRLAAGQHPLAIVLTCSDSRVVPEMIFGRKLGEIFVIRVAGNVTDPNILGSIEYGVEHLHIPLIVVLGHTHCGAVKAAVERPRLECNLSLLIAAVDTVPSLPGVDGALAVDQSVRHNVLSSARELTEKSAPIRDAVLANHTRIVSGVYSLETGKVQWLGGPTGAAQAR